MSNAFVGVVGFPGDLFEWNLPLCESIYIRDLLHNTNKDFEIAGHDLNGNVMTKPALPGKVIKTNPKNKRPGDKLCFDNGCWKTKGMRCVSVPSLPKTLPKTLSKTLPKNLLRKQNITLPSDKEFQIWKRNITQACSAPGEVGTCVCAGEYSCCDALSPNQMSCHFDSCSSGFMVWARSIADTDSDSLFHELLCSHSGKIC